MAEVIICEPRKDCADPHVLRWYCMRGHDGAAPGICPLTVCERRGANREPGLMTTPPPLCGGDHDDTGIEDCDACQAEVLEPITCGPHCPACCDDGREYAWGVV